MIQLIRIAVLSNNLKVLPLSLLLFAGGILSIGELSWNTISPMFSTPAATVQAAQVATATYTPSPTHTATILPTSTVLPTQPPSPTAVPPGWDFYEPNDTLENATDLTVSQTLPDLTIAPPGDIDFFRIYGKAGQILNIVTFVNAGTDTFLRLYSAGGSILAENDDKSTTDLGSAIIWTPNADGWLIVSVESAVPTYEGQYDLSILLEAPTPTHTPVPPQPTSPPPSPPPTHTPVPPPVEADKYEPNNSADGAAEIIIGATYQGTLPPGDVDYYRLLTKSSNEYQCDTKADGVDTAISVFNQNLELLVENDDRAPNDLSSSVTWTALGESQVYIVVQNRAGLGGYSLLCNVPLPPTRPAGGGGNAQKPPTPIPTSTPFPTPTPSLIVRYLGDKQPAPTPVVETTVRLVVVYDKNGNRAADTGEGIKNISVRALYGGRIVGWGLTDDRGEVTLSIAGNVNRITIPYFNFWEIRVTPGDDIGPRTVVIPPVSLPVILPVETPAPPE